MSPAYRFSDGVCAPSVWNLRYIGTVRMALPLLLLLGLFLLAGPVLHWLDPVAAVVDLGALSLLLLGLLVVLACVSVCHWLLGLLWPVFRDFHRYHLEPLFKSLLPWQKICIYFACFFLLLYASLLALVAVF